MTGTEALFGTALSLNVAGRERTELEIRASRIRRAFIELEERLIGLRMISLSQTLARAARVGSIAARTLGRNVEIEIEGADVRLDKSVADAISDPLLHLLRNAVSHGIESAEERLAQGKPESGTVRIEAVSEGSRVCLRVADDGRGIDPELVARVAVERGLIEDGTGLTKHESLRMIFRPGFSTANLVSDVSGRGVGLDVVEKAIEQVGGELRVSSEPGTGTTFEMVLPTTLALAPSLVVSSAGYKYTVDASHISEAGYVSLDDIEISNAGEVTVWRGIRMPVLRLRKLLGQEEESGLAPERFHVVISHIAGQAEAEQDSESDSSEQKGSAAVVVDSWDGHSDVLVRSLGRHAALWRGVSGAAELRDGSIALVLDLPRLLEMNTSSVGMD
jgi:two-component system chemotaxis sensor kinase CheA